MTKEDIRLHLIERYVNGYSVIDETYDNIKNIIVKEIDHIRNKKELQEILKKYLGQYSDYTGGLYYEVLSIYIKKVLHKKPDPETISYLIS